jgi:hypothetical protein
MLNWNMNSQGTVKILLSSFLENRFQLARCSLKTSPSSALVYKGNATHFIVFNGVGVMCARNAIHTIFVN